MSDIKDLFEKQKGQQILANASLSKVGAGVESPDYVKVNIEDKERFVPYVNFASASNFARYGLAEKYYEDSINYISNEYPYDGSEKEKIEWHLSSSYLDRFIFKNEYPRTTGYINFGLTYAEGMDAHDSTGYDTPENVTEWISFQGNNTNYSANATLNTNLSLQFNQLKLYNTASQGRSNLELEGSRGVSVEFWINKQDFTYADECRRQVVVDVWNNGTFGETGYGRFRIEISGTENNVLEPNFHVELLSGSAGFSSATPSDEPPTVVLSGSVLTGSWNHIAITVANDGTQMTGRLYTNGNLDYIHTAGTSMGLITGSMEAQIGSLITEVSGGGGSFSGTSQGDAKLSASLDEFRFWKKVRTPQQIGRNWFTQVGGGTNTDITLAATASTKYSYENPVDLGVYYKFNEGIFGSSSYSAKDAKILDYAGRSTNGLWSDYTYGGRSSGSAIVESSASLSEFKDPIIYSTHPNVTSLLDTKKELGRAYDYQNNANIYHSFPSWILGEDEDNDRNTLKDLTQIMASYFDTLHLQIKAVPEIKNVRYATGSDKPYPFANRLINSLGLSTSDIFANATDLEYLASKNDFTKFTEKLEDTKNKIYQNIYNNLIYIYKSKGTEKSFRNLIRCFGVGEELVGINLYGSDITYELRNNSDFRTIKKKYANFYNPSRFTSTVFQQTSSTNANSREYISSSMAASWGGNTYEAEAIFAMPIDIGDPNYVQNEFVSSSLFGCHTSGSGNTWASPDRGNFQVHSIRPQLDSKDAYFQLSGSDGYQLSHLTSSLFKDVFDGSKWNFSVRIKPSKYPLAPSVTASAGAGPAGTFDLDFSGYNYVLDKLVNNFTVTSSVTMANAINFLTSSKRFFVGAHRQDFDSTVLQQSDAKISSLRVWMNHLDNETLRAHAQDAENFGTKYPYKSAYISQDDHFLGEAQIVVPQMETLVLNWNFDTITSSNASGQFVVPDASSGSAALTSRWGWLGSVSQYQYTGLGYGFPANDTGSVSREYVYSSKQQLPETLQSSDMISLVDDSQNQMFVRDSRPIDYSFAFEKSMNAVVSQQMINYFATIIAFNNLIGEPVNRYRQDYKDLEKLRALYFERVQNTPDFEKFVEFFKWIDASLGLMLIQLAPASSYFSEKLRNVVESHILERNKYWNKFPTLEMKAGDPEAGLRGINELLYSGKRGSAPIPTTATASNCVWWLDRAERGGENITSGDSIIDGQRNKYRLANDFRSGSGPTLAMSRDSTATTTTYEGNVYAIRNFTQPYRFTVQEMPEIHGGSNFPRAKTVEYAHESLKYDSSEQLEIAASSVAHEKNCNDVVDPNIKNRLECKVTNTAEPQGYLSGKGTIFAPFSLFSSSVTGGYVADVATNFRTKTEINNYHDDIYGDDKGIPVQGPFTEAHVGGRQHRHIDVNTSSATTTLTRPEAWNLSVDSETLTVGPRTSDQPRAIYVRDEYAKRPLNIRNIKWGTGSAVAGNYRFGYEVVQTSGRKLNNRYFIASDGFNPPIWDSGYVSGVVDYALPRYDLVGTNKSIFVERFSAPGGPEVNSRGVLDINAEEYSVYNELNQRNLIVRKALDGWQTDHCGVFGTNWEDGTVSVDNYNTNASYHKVNRNRSVKHKLINWSDFVHMAASDNGTSLTKTGGAVSWADAGAAGDYLINSGDGIQFVFAKRPAIAWLSSDQVIIGMSENPPALTTHTDMKYAIYRHALGIQCRVDGGTAPYSSGYFEEIPGATYSILRFSGKVYFFVDNTVFYSVPDTALGVTLKPDITMLANGGRVWGVKAFSVDHTFDNWYVQHDIPQSELQYAWINDSYDNTLDQPFGYVSSYSVPSGTTSTTAEAVQFDSGSTWGFEGITNGHSYPVNYTSMIPQLPPDANVNVADTRWGLGDDSTATGRILPGWISQTSSLTIFNDSTRTHLQWLVLDVPSGQYGQYENFADGTTSIKSDGYLEFVAPSYNNDFAVALNDPTSVFIEENTNVIGKALNRLDYVMAIGSYTAGSTWCNIYEDGNLVHQESDWEELETRFRILRYSNRIYYQKQTPNKSSYYNLQNVLNSAPWETFYRSSKPVKQGIDLFPVAVLGQNNVTGVGPYTVQAGPFWLEGFDTTNQLMPGFDFSIGSFSNPLTSSINSYFNNINGPYGYPSWKQIRTGETPVARYQRRNNILSVMAPARLVELANGNGPGQTAVYLNTRMDAYKKFIEPPVTFKYKPLDTVISQEDGRQLKLRHSYGNNKCIFSQAPVTVLSELGNVETPNSRSITDYLKIPNDKPDNQIYDLMRSDDEVWDGLSAMLYSEVVYPRGANTGLAKTRGRTKYAETANGILNLTGTISASLSIDHNGIDRGPLERRTFWRDKARDRNRIDGRSEETYYIDDTVGMTTPPLELLPGAIFDSYPSLASGPSLCGGTLLNSQGHRDAFATSINGMGSTPITWAQYRMGILFIAPGLAVTSSIGFYYIPPSASAISGAGAVWKNGDVGTGVFQGGSTGSLNYTDMGELNSANEVTIMGYFGTYPGSGRWLSSSNGAAPPYSYAPVNTEMTSSWAARCTYYPTASAYYIHQQTNYTPWVTVDVMRGKWPWRVAELSGKKPWYDSYAEYAYDIRQIAKNYTIVPEFNISQQMPYYADGRFKKPNAKILSLPGAEITSSALTEVNSDGRTRTYDEDFFKEYSNTDFQKYFGKFSTDHNVSNITLKCNAVKKLLPYHGFYPMQRTLQLAAMFSQSLGPYITGLDWISDGNTGSLPAIAGTAQTGALAMQSLLQPYFAPGIMYNTIKSGIAIDWATFTGSAPSSSNFLEQVGGPYPRDDYPNLSNTSISQSANYRIPFESILDPLSHIGIPESSADGKMFLLYPTYNLAFKSSISQVFYQSQDPCSITPDGVTHNDGYCLRQPYVEISDYARRAAQSADKYKLYKLAMNNFFAEIPNFFLEGNKLKSITSPNTKRQGDISLVSGTTYYMDIWCEQSADHFMIADHWDGHHDITASVSGAKLCQPNPGGGGAYLGFLPPQTGIQDGRAFRSQNGRYFGPPYVAGTNWPPDAVDWSEPPENYWGTWASIAGDPAYAPYTPPYFYGKSKLTIKYTADESDIENFSFKKMFANSLQLESNISLERMFNKIKFPTDEASPAQQSSMPLTASLDIFGIYQEKQSRLDSDGRLVMVVDDPNPDRNRWVISPKMETPVLDFNDQPRVLNTGRGMWGGYGKLLTESKGITFGIDETFKDFDPDTGLRIITPSQHILWEGQGYSSTSGSGWGITASVNDTYLDRTDLVRAFVPAGGTVDGWTSFATGSVIVAKGDTIEAKLISLTSSVMFGLNELHPNLGSDYSDMAYSIQTIKVGPVGTLDIYEFGTQTKSGAGQYAAGDYIRLLYDTDNKIKYQHSSGSSGIFNTIYETSIDSIEVPLKPAISLYSTNAGVDATRIIKPDITVATGSLIRECFETIPEPQQIGEVAEEKMISEAIVAIPFSPNFVARGSSMFPSTTRIMGKHFFEIQQGKFDLFREQFMRTDKDWAAFYANIKASGGEMPIDGVSIPKMLKLMSKYVIPPELDCLTYAEKYGFSQENTKVNPFVMYLFEFKHKLNDQDLADIWQGLMPKIATTAELSNPDIDNNIFTHPTGPNEFFHGKTLPHNIKWMVFKVKRKANWDYNELTKKNIVDEKFNFRFDVGNVRQPYSYNWPYDYFSLVELAQMEVTDTMTKRGASPKAVTQAELMINPLQAETTTTGSSGGGISAGGGY